MRPLGPAEGHILTASAGSGTGSRAGASVSLLVEERLGPGLYRATSGGATYLLRSKSELALGSLVQDFLPPGAGPSGTGLAGDGASRAAAFGAAAARAGSSGAGLGGAGLSGAGLPGAAAPDRPDGASALLSRLGLPDDGASRLALSALLKEGQRPEAGALRRVRSAALGGGPGEGGSRAELAARLEAKGLCATDAALEALADALSGQGGGGDRGSGGSGDGGQAGGSADSGSHDGGSAGDGIGGGDGGSGDSGGPGGSAGGDGSGGPGQEGRGRGDAGLTASELERGFRREVPEEELPALLGGLLRGLAGRSSPGAGVLGLFNHARGPEGGWMALPIRFSLDAVDFAGSLRILLPYIVGGPGRMEARFFASRGGAEASAWGFDLSFGGGRKASLVIRAEGRREEAERLLPGLAEALAASGCSVRLAGSGDPDPSPEGRLDLGA